MSDYDYVELIVAATRHLEIPWPRHEDAHETPQSCDLCDWEAGDVALVGPHGICHAWHADYSRDDSADALSLLLQETRSGRRVDYWLGRLHVGTAVDHPSGDIAVWAFVEDPVTVTREADIIPALMRLWGFHVRTVRCSRHDL